MKILIACEYSGIVRDAFKARGHDATSCDFLQTDKTGKHHKGDVLHLIHQENWDMMIAFPPCTYLCSSGLHWNKRRPERQMQTDAALTFVAILMAAPIDKIAIENPVGCISTKIKPASQYVHPHQFGEDASKKTGLWLKNLPLLTPTKVIPPDVRGRYANQTASGQNKLGPSKDRWKIRSTTYQGIANAMSEQWG